MRDPRPVGATIPCRPQPWPAARPSRRPAPLELGAGDGDGRSVGVPNSTVAVNGYRPPPRRLTARGRDRVVRLRAPAQPTGMACCIEHRPGTLRTWAHGVERPDPAPTCSDGCSPTRMPTTCGSRGSGPVLGCLDNAEGPSGARPLLRHAGQAVTRPWGSRTNFLAAPLSKS
jgi:hypothetical protein